MTTCSPFRSATLALALLVATFLVATVPSHAQAPGPDLTGTWQGTWHRSSGDARVRLVLRNPYTRTQTSEYSGNLELVEQPGLAFRLFPLRLRDHTIAHTPEGDGDREDLRATLRADGDTITGTFAAADGLRALELTRVPAAPAPAPPTAEQLHGYLATAAARTSLLSGKPFHLSAEIVVDGWDGRGNTYPALFDELYRDPDHWRLTLTYLGNTYTETRNGHNATTTGDVIHLEPVQGHNQQFETYDLLPPIEDALFRPVPPELLNSHHLAIGEPESCAYETVLGDPILYTPGAKQEHPAREDTLHYGSCARILAEPELPGVASNVPVALTAYNLGAEDLLPYEVGTADVHGLDDSFEQIERQDFQPFEALSIPRRIRVVNRGNSGHLLSIRITALETATHFSAIRLHGAPNIMARHQQDSPVGRIIHGQELRNEQTHVAGVPDEIYHFFCQGEMRNNDMGPGIPLLIHTNIQGRADSAQLLQNPIQLMYFGGAGALTILARDAYRFRVSYRDGEAVADDHVVFTGGCVTP